MPFQSLRFLHAAQALLDIPPQDVGSVAADLRDELADISLTAFARLVDECVERQVDFLLLSGDTFDAADLTSRAGSAFEDACERLRAATVHVVVVPGERDPADFWQDYHPRPRGLTVLSHNDRRDLEIGKEGAPHAIIQLLDDEDLRTPYPGQFGPYDPPNPNPQPPFVVGVPGPLLNRYLTDLERTHDWAACFDAAAVNYLAAGGPVRRSRRESDNCLSASPGSLWSETAEATGVHGVWCVEVTVHGEVRQEFVPLSPVRRERTSLTLTERSSRDDLMESMLLAGDALEPAPGERIRLLDWQLTGRGELMRRLADADYRRQLLSEFEQWQAGDENLRIHHRLRRHLEPSDAIDGAFDALHEFLHRLEQRREPDERELHGMLDRVGHEFPTARQAAAWIDRLPPEDVMTAARQWGIRHLDDGFAKEGSR